MNSAHAQEYLEDNDDSSDETAALLVKHTTDEKQSQATDSGESLGLAEEAKSMPEISTLALTSSQFAMIDALDGVGFDKFPVHIHDARHSHAAIIVRMQRESFREGKIVVRHWLERFEV